MNCAAPSLVAVLSLAEPSKWADGHAWGLLPDGLDRAAIRAAMALPRILIPSEAAEVLRVHAKTVIRACRNGQIPGAFQIGRSWRIPESAIAALCGVEEDESADPVDDAGPEVRAPAERETAEQEGSHLHQLLRASVGKGRSVVRDLLRAPLLAAREPALPTLEPGMLTLAMAAGALKVNVSRVRAMCRAGKIPGAQRIGNSSWRIPEDAIEGLKNERRKRPAGGGGT